MDENRDLVVLAGRSNPQFARALCSTLNCTLGKLEVVTFSDGEVFVEVGENVRGRDVFVVQSTCAPTNDNLMELLITMDALRRASAGRITAVTPYFGYARQDRKTKPRVPITAKLVANLITEAGANRVLAMDLHAGQLMGFFDIPVDNLNALPVLVPFLQSKYGSGPVTVVSPDVGGVERARQVATRLNNAPLAIIDKRRSGPNQVAEMHVVGDVRGTTCILVDDMIDTGGTIVKAAETLVREGATKVVAAAVHPVFSNDAIVKLERSALAEIVVTDTIPFKALPSGNKITCLSVAPLIAHAIQRIHREDSVSGLLT